MDGWMGVCMYDIHWKSFGMVWNCLDAPEHEKKAIVCVFVYGIV